MLSSAAEMPKIRTDVPMPEMHTVPEAERVLKCSRSTVYELVNSGQLMRINIGKKALIVNLREYIQRKVQEARQSAA